MKVVPKIYIHYTFNALLLMDILNQPDDGCPKGASPIRQLDFLDFFSFENILKKTVVKGKKQESPIFFWKKHLWDIQCHLK